MAITFYCVYRVIDKIIVSAYTAWKHELTVPLVGESEVHPSVARRIIIKFVTYEGVKPSEILRRLQAQFPDNCLKKPQVYEWHNQFSAEREAVENEPHGRRTRTNLTEQNITAVREIIERDRRLTIMKTESEVEISYGNAETIIVDKLRFWKISARLIPHLLTDQMKQNRLEISQRFRVEGENFLHHIIVTCDETWVHHYKAESKQAEWRKKG